ncbi:MAG: SDR family NAD(P)-dependent oxidoreductase [Bacillota bacterium]|nr:SDR family NAD(P)-dependent oxidoreductase [Bacillota bacterium]
MGRYRQLFELGGRVALVAGAASGLGRASAEALADFGAHVVCADLDAQGAERTAEAIRAAGGEASAVALDLTDPEAVSRVVEATAARRGRLDVAVTTPGVNVRKRLLDLSTAEFDRVIGLNLRGTFHFLRAAGRRMAAQGGGSLIAFASIRAQVVEPGQGAYAATKAGTLQLVRALAAELGPRGVRANAVAPGVIETPLTAPIRSDPEWARQYAARTALGRWGEPEEVATAVVYLASDASRYVTGTLFLVDGGWTAVDGRYEPPL